MVDFVWVLENRKAKKSFSLAAAIFLCLLANLVGSTQYNHDHHIQQTQPTAQTLTIAYQYDKVGNRTARNVTGAITQTTTYQYDTNDRLTQSIDSIHGTTNYRYDLRGNLTEKANGSDITRYSWNSDNRLIKVEQSGSTNKTTTYGYDPQGRRIKKLVFEGSNKTETHYHLDTERAYHEIVIERTRVNTNAWTKKTYVHTPGGIGELISEHDGTTTKQIYTDAQGTTRLIADSTGTHQRYHFDAFGNWLAGDSLDGSAPTHLYTGERYDQDTGLVYLRARDYDPETGRFISMDEHPGDQRIPLTLNKYLYANADPVNFIDPSGYFGFGIGGLGGVGNAISFSLRAFNFYQSFIDPLLENSDNEIPTIWDMVMQVVMGGAAGLFNGATSASPGLVFGWQQLPLPFGRPERHHTIPIYMCGAKPEVIQETSIVDSKLHHALHNNLDKMVLTVEIAGKIADLTLNRRAAGVKSKNSTKPIMMRVARTRSGRALLVSALLIRKLTTLKF